MVQVAHKMLVLQMEVGIERVLARFVQQLFDAGQCIGGTFVQRLGQFQCGGQCAAGVGQAVDQAQNVQALGAGALATHQ